MTIAHIVTRGYGNGTLDGTIAAIVMRGYIAGEEVVDERVTGGWLSPEQVRRLRAMAKESQRDDRNESRRRKQRVARRLAELEALYDIATGAVPASIANEPAEVAEAVEGMAEVVRPFAASSDKALPPTRAIDWPALLASRDAVRDLSMALVEASAAKQEEEALMLLMMTA